MRYEKRTYRHISSARRAAKRAGPRGQQYIFVELLDIKKGLVKTNTVYTTFVKVKRKK